MPRGGGTPVNQPGQGGSSSSAAAARDAAGSRRRNTRNRRRKASGNGKAMEELKLKKGLKY